MTISIEETTPNGDARKQFTLFVNDFPAAHVQVLPHGVHLNWAVYGPQQWPEAKLVLEGLLELSLLADQLTVGVPHEKVKRHHQKAQREDQGDESPFGEVEIKFGRRKRAQQERAVGRSEAGSIAIARIADREERPSRTAGKAKGRKPARTRRNGP